MPSTVELIRDEVKIWTTRSEIRSQPLVSKRKMQKQLSPRELSLLTHLEQGSTNRKIAVAHGIPEAAVYVYLRQLCKKLGIATISEARMPCTRANVYQIQLISDYASNIKI